MSQPRQTRSICAKYVSRCRTASDRTLSLPNVPHKVVCAYCLFCASLAAHLSQHQRSGATDRYCLSSTYPCDSPTPNDAEPASPGIPWAREAACIIMRTTRLLSRVSTVSSNHRFTGRMEQPEVTRSAAKSGSVSAGCAGLLGDGQ